MNFSESRSMSYQERDFFVLRILNGYANVRSKGRTFQVHCPTLDVNYRASEVYLKALRRSNGMMEETSYPFLGRLWPTDKEKELEEIPETIKKLQKDLYKSVIWPSKVREIRIELIKIRSRYAELLEEKGRYSSYTSEGYAAFAKSNYLLRRIVKYKGKLYDFSWHNIAEANVFLTHAFVDSDVLRYIARTTPWANIYSSAKTSGSIFPVSGVELTQSQQILLMWSKTYDDIYQCPDCPHESVIEDDDMLDGWLLIQKEERDREKKDKSSEKLSQNDKINNSQEVYIVAKSKEDAKAIYGLNTPKNRNIVKQRIDTVHNRGTVREQDLPDVQQRLIIEAGQSYHNTLKGKK